MTSKLCHALLIVTLQFTLGGCAVLPYADTFDCPQTDKGQCVSVSQAHEAAVSGIAPEEETAQAPTEGKETASVLTLPQASDSETIRIDLLTEYAKGERNPVPALAPPVIMETIILPYQTDEGALAGERTLWVPVEEATWAWPEQSTKHAAPEIGVVMKK